MAWDRGNQREEVVRGAERAHTADSKRNSRIDGSVRGAVSRRSGVL